MILDISMVTGNVVINGKSYQTNGGSLKIDVSGNVIINGKTVDVIEDKKIEVFVTGEVESLQTTSGNITIDGNVSKNVKTVSGDVRVSGDISGDVQTVSGDVKSEKILGNVKTVSGDIN